jgi:hypothetical protein
VAHRGLRKLLVTGPMAVVAVGLGFMAQGLGSAPSSGDRRLLDSLIASPTAARSVSPVAARVGDGSSQSGELEGLQARRAVASTGQGVDLVEPEAGAPVDLEIRVALLSRSPVGSLSATGPWLLRSRTGATLARGSGGQAVNIAWQQAGARTLAGNHRRPPVAGGWSGL